MMESVLDGNDNNEFCSKEYALIEIDNLEGNAWEGDKQTAEKNNYFLCERSCNNYKN